MNIVFNPFTGNFDYVNSASAMVIIPELTADPSSPVSGETWVRHMQATDSGSPIGLLLSLTYAGSVAGPYELSYKALDGSVVRTTLV